MPSGSRQTAVQVFSVKDTTSIKSSGSIITVRTIPPPPPPEELSAYDLDDSLPKTDSSYTFDDLDDALQKVEKVESDPKDLAGSYYEDFLFQGNKAKSGESSLHTWVPSMFKYLQIFGFLQEKASFCEKKAFVSKSETANLQRRGKMFRIFQICKTNMLSFSRCKQTMEGVSTVETWNEP